MFQDFKGTDRWEINGIFTENQDCFYIAGIVNSGKIVENAIY